LALEDDGDFDEARLGAHIARARDSDAQTLIYSDETVTNSPIRTIAAKRLHRMMPNAEIVAVVRNQFDALESYYAGHGRQLRPAPAPWGGRHVTFENYLAYNLENPRRGALPTFDYSSNLAIYASLFGEDRIHVLTYEDLIQNRDAFFVSLARILGIAPKNANPKGELGRERARADNGTIAYQALRSRLLWGKPVSRFVPGHQHIRRIAIRMLSRGEKRAIEWPSALRVRIADYYGDGNRTLAERHALPLSKFGYPM
ncbi:MAG: sulfotransferase, partial [Rhodospirillaceae bacterium]